MGECIAAYSYIAYSHLLFKRIHRYSAHGINLIYFVRAQAFTIIKFFRYDCYERLRSLFMVGSWNDGMEWNEDSVDFSHGVSICCFFNNYTYLVYYYGC